MKKTLLLTLTMLMGLFFLPARSLAAPAGAPEAVAAEDEEEDEEEPYVEPPFTVYLTIDNPKAVSITIYYDHNATTETVVPVKGENVITVDPGTGYIKVTPNEGYVYWDFRDMDLSDRDGASFLSYDYQAYPVTIRKVLKTSDTDIVELDGHHFDVRTLALSTLSTFNMTVDIDDPSKAIVRVGHVKDFYSQANRTVQLHEGENTITYSEIDKYILIGSASLKPLHSVVFEGTPIPIDSNFDSWHTIYLEGIHTDGYRLEIRTTAPEIPEPYTFTANIDDVEQVKYFTQKKTNGAEKEHIYTLANGDNSFSFSEGDVFEVWTYTDALECTLDGTDVESNPFYGVQRYIFTPADGSAFMMRFNEIEKVPGFTIDIDDASAVEAFVNTNDPDWTFTLRDGANFIPVEYEGDSYYIRLNGGAAAVSFTLDGADVSRTPRYGRYNFTPSTDSEIVIVTREVAVPTEINFTLTIDNPEAAEVRADNTVLPLVAGENPLSVPVDENYIQIIPAQGYILTVTGPDGSLLEPNYLGVFHFMAAEGDRVSIASQSVEFNESFMMVVDGEPEFGMMISGSEREILLEPGYAEVLFNTDYDQFFLFAFDEPAATAVFLNGEELPFDADNECYFYEPADGDILHVFFDDNYAVHNVDLVVNPEVEGKFVIYRDLFQVVDHRVAQQREVTNTAYVIIPEEGAELKVILQNPVARDGDEEVPFDKDEGAFFLFIDSDVRLSILPKTTGIETIHATEAPADIYNLQGIRVGSDPASLPAGIYISAGRKIIVR